ncbi:hypothetical protein [Prevotella aurantiaca]|jgi:hypothetical protein|uniref:hypothetical protein n=1 Tax=Prevotella aurantiaca TaxID=596085 RepID=UPI0023F10DEF
MKKVLTTIFMLSMATMLLQCSTKSEKKEAVVKQKKEVSPQKYNRVLTKEQLKAMGIDWKKLMKHLKLQEVSWYGGDFRDDQSEPRYEPTREDFLLTIPLVEYYMNTHGYKKPSDELFKQRIQAVFGMRLNMQSKKLYQPLYDEEYFDYASIYFALNGKGIITYNWMLNDMLKVRHEKIVLKPKILQQILALNNFIVYEDAAAFKFLSQATFEGNEEDYDGMGDPYDGERILSDLFSVYQYYGSDLLNQWYFTTQDVNPIAFFHQIFEKTTKGKLIVQLPLIKLIEKNTTGNNNRAFSEYFKNLVFDLLNGENNMNTVGFSFADKAKIFCYFAASEHKMRAKYAKYIPSMNEKAYWDRSSSTSSMILQHPEVYSEASNHNFFGVVKPAVMKAFAEESKKRKDNE